MAPGEVEVLAGGAASAEALEPLLLRWSTDARDGFHASLNDVRHRLRGELDSLSATALPTWLEAPLVELANTLDGFKILEDQEVEAPKPWSRVRRVRFESARKHEALLAIERLQLAVARVLSGKRALEASRQREAKLEQKISEFRTHEAKYEGELAALEEADNPGLEEKLRHARARREEKELLLEEQKKRTAIIQETWMSTDDVSNEAAADAQARARALTELVSAELGGQYLAVDPQLRAALATRSRRWRVAAAVISISVLTSVAAAAWFHWRATLREQEAASAALSGLKQEVLEHPFARCCFLEEEKASISSALTKESVERRFLAALEAIDASPARTYEIQLDQAAVFRTGMRPVESTPMPGGKQRVEVHPEIVAGMKARYGPDTTVGLVVLDAKGEALWVPGPDKRVATNRVLGRVDFVKEAFCANPERRSVVIRSRLKLPFGKYITIGTNDLDAKAVMGCSTATR